MPVVHDREQLLGLINALSERSYADGILIDIPKARRREQAKNPQKQLRIGLEGDLKIRMATQIERYLAHYGSKGIAWDELLKRLEEPFEMSDPFVLCTVCGRPKKPVGRDSFDTGLCQHDCEGYRLEPAPSPYWPGERDRAQSG